MPTLLSRNIEMIALAPRSIGRNRICEWAAVLDLSHQITLDGAKAPIEISKIDASYLHRKLLNIDIRSDPENAVAFRMPIGRDIVKKYIGIATEFIKEKDEHHNEKETIRQYSRKVIGTIFNGELSRDFALKVHTIILAAHIADPVGVAVNRMVSLSLSGGATSERFQLRAEDRNGNFNILNFKRLASKEVYEYLWNRRVEISGKPSSQAMRGLSYISQIFQNADNPLANFMWSVASIEAMLSRSSEKINIDVIEDRIRAILPVANIDSIIGNFRDAYKYRNALYHGNVVLPFSFDGRNFFGFPDVRHSVTYPLEVATFAYGLAIRIFQRFFEMTAYDVGYQINAFSR